MLGGVRNPWEGTDRDYKYEEVCLPFPISLLFYIIL